jgi:hypothetical protein
MEKLSKVNEVKNLAHNVQQIMRRNDYGLGECNYFFKEQEKEWVEDYGLDGNTAREWSNEAYDLLEKAEAINATI